MRTRVQEALGPAMVECEGALREVHVCEGVLPERKPRFWTKVRRRGLWNGGVWPDPVVQYSAVFRAAPLVMAGGERPSGENTVGASLGWAVEGLGAREGTHAGWVRLDPRWRWRPCLVELAEALLELLTDEAEGG
jgi:hypothetical protein